MQLFSSGSTARTAAAALAATALAYAVAGAARADEGEALFKAMSDFLAAQPAFAFDYDATLDVVTTDGQKLAIASSGQAAVERPDRLHATRTGGFASVEASFDGETLTLLNRDENVYAEEKIPGSIDGLIDTLRETYHRPLPAADLLSGDVHATLMEVASEVRDLGSGVIGGVECDHIAFRGEHADWQIWIAQGDSPFPCRYTITAPDMTGAPEYTVVMRNWTTGPEAVAQLAFELPAEAKSVAAEDLPDFDAVAGIYMIEGAQ